MTLPKEVVLEALRCCRDVYPNEKDYLVSRKIDGYTILAVEGTNETTDWVTNLKFLLRGMIVTEDLRTMLIGH